MKSDKARALQRPFDVGFVLNDSAPFQQSLKGLHVIRQQAVVDQAPNHSRQSQHQKVAGAHVPYPTS
jgi:hypothetical protein